MTKRILCILVIIFLFSRPSFSQKDLGLLKEDYFKDHRYDEFVVYLKDLRKRRSFSDAQLSYYIALTRYNQLKYLEENQNWDAYFKYGNLYRDELVKEAKKAIDSTSFKDKINLYAHTLLWQFYKTQQIPQEIELKKALQEAC
ncbi:MAG: hypothetical protein NC909_01740, partial [Candidatus Omnitrophica bacterium]|nr:hypothetical protein [Candidatus Omnitrophota bacterium]